MAHQNTASSSMMEWVIKLPKKVFILTCLCWLNYTEFCCFCFFKQVPGVWEVKPSLENTALWPIPMSSLRVHPEYIYILNDPVHTDYKCPQPHSVSALLTESPEDNSYKIISRECTNPMTNWQVWSHHDAPCPQLSSMLSPLHCLHCQRPGPPRSPWQARHWHEARQIQPVMDWLSFLSVFESCPPLPPTAALYSGSSPPILICLPSASDAEARLSARRWSESMEWVAL